MKRLVWAIILLAIIIGLTLVSSLTINRYYRELTNHINKIDTLYKQGESTGEQLDALEKYWAKAEPMLMFFANHESVEEIGIHINRLSSLSNTNASDTFTAESAELKTIIGYLKDSENLSFESIF